MRRELLSLALREQPTHLFPALAAAIGVPSDQVRALSDDADPVVRVETQQLPRGFQLLVDLFVDPLRMRPPALPVLAVRLAREAGIDVAHHDGSLSPYGYVLVKPDGRRFAADEIVAEPDEGLVLDEEDLREMPSLEEGTARE